MGDAYGRLDAHPITRAVSDTVLTRLERLRRPPLPSVGALPAPLWPKESGHLVTVAVPNYNYGRYLPRAVASAVEQKGVRVEVVIVDDRSTDDSFDIAQALAAQYENVTALRNPENVGHGHTFNRAWQAGTGDFVVRLDADDLLTPGSLARAVAIFEAFPAVGLVYGRVQHFSGAEPEADPSAAAAASGVVWAGADWSQRMLLDNRNLIATPEAMLRRAAMETYGAWKPELPHSQDLEMWLRAATFYDVGYVQGVAQAFKRFHAESMDLKGSVGAGRFHAHRNAFDSWYGEIADLVPDADLRYSVARQGVADHAVREATHAYRRGKADHVPVDELVALATELADNPSGLRTLQRYAKATETFGPTVVRWSPPALLGSVRERLRQAGTHARLERDGY